ncbi:MAG: preprotein translocase subunit SecG [Candidatus Omnitrophica bacterium]|nr:preprotein translocase subunit SecG [Candidatus Omnitrophota bacterium]
MYSFVWILHVLVVIGLVAVILVQRGRSGGLVEALGGIESVFGTKTNNFFVNMTVFLAILFFMTSVTLAYLSKQRGRSLIKNIPQAETGQTASQEIPDSK